MLYGTANLIKLANASSLDFEAIPVAGKKIKNVLKFSPQNDNEAGNSGNQNLVHSKPNRGPKNRLDFCRGTNNLGNRFHEVSNESLVNSGRIKMLKKRTMSNYTLTVAFNKIGQVRIRINKSNKKYRLCKFRDRFYPKKGSALSSFPSEKTTHRSKWPSGRFTG